MLEKYKFVVLAVCFIPAGIMVLRGVLQSHKEKKKGKANAKY